MASSHGSHTRQHLNSGNQEETHSSSQNLEQQEEQPQPQGVPHGNMLEIIQQFLQFYKQVPPRNIERGEQTPDAQQTEDWSLKLETNF